MADDEIERLLREIDATNATPTTSGGQVEKKGGVPATSGGSAGGRVAFAVAAAVVLGMGSWFVGLILPFTSAVSAGIGGAFAAFVTAIIAGPPRWFSS